MKYLQLLVETFTFLNIRFIKFNFQNLRDSKAYKTSFYYFVDFIQTHLFLRIWISLDTKIDFFLLNSERDLNNIFIYFSRLFTNW